MIIKEIISIVFILTGILDSYKYRISAKKIRKIKSANGRSRMFINIALLHSIIRLLFALVWVNNYLLCVGLLSLLCVIDNLWAIYIYYPYRKRNLNNFKKPNFILYFINSWLPNRIRRRL